MKKINLKNITIILNLLLILLFAGYFVWHGLPQSLMLWLSATLWLIVPVVNLFFIYKNESKIK